MIRCMFNFLCSKSSNLVTNNFFYEKEDWRGKIGNQNSELWQA